MDQRDTQTWVAIELSHLGEEKVQDGTLVGTLRQDLGAGDDFPIFIPAASYPKGRRRVTLLLMEGYVFVASGLPDTKYFELEKRPYIALVMSTVSGEHQMRAVTTIPNSTVEDLRQQLRQMVSSDIPLDARVRVTDGSYRNLEGIVRGLTRGYAFVEIHLRSLEVVATIPCVMLEALDPLAEEDKGR